MDFGEILRGAGGGRKKTREPAFMESARCDLGEALRKKHGEQAPASLGFAAGNAVVMAQMVE